MPLDPRDLGPPHRLQPQDSPQQGPPDRLLQKRLLELEREKWRRVCRSYLLPFAIEALAPKGETPAEHHELMIRELETMLRGETRRLLMLGPRGCAKTTYVSHLLPAFAFAKYPGTNIIAGAHSEKLALENSEQVRRIIEVHSGLLGYGLESDARDQWRTTNGCVYYARGAGQGVRGLRANWIVCDDLIKSRQDAESPVERDTLWRYFRSDLMGCLKPRGGVVIIATAYHEMDIVCRLEREQSDTWKMVRMSAISEGEGDVLGRPEGVPLWAGSPYGDKMLADRDAAELHGWMQDFYSEYQGRPRAAEGNLFRPAEMPVLDQIPVGIVTGRVRAWDFASSTKTTADYTVGLLLVRVLDVALNKTKWVIADLRRIRGTPEQVEQLVLEVARSDGYGTTIFIPQDPAQAGAAQVANFTRLLAGYPLASERANGDKRTRAMAVAAQSNIGNVGMFKAAWNAALIEELASFPNGQHDDQADALSSAFSELEQNDVLAEWARL